MKFKKTFQRWLWILLGFLTLGIVCVPMVSEIARLDLYVTSQILVKNNTATEETDIQTQKWQNWLQIETDARKVISQVSDLQIQNELNQKLEYYKQVYFNPVKGGNFDIVFNDWKIVDRDSTSGLGILQSHVSALEAGTGVENFYVKFLVDIEKGELIKAFNFQLWEYENYENEDYQKLRFLIYSENLWGGVAACLYYPTLDFSSLDDSNNEFTLKKIDDKCFSRNWVSVDVNDKKKWDDAFLILMILKIINFVICKVIWLFLAEYQILLLIYQYQELFYLIPLNL